MAKRAGGSGGSHQLACAFTCAHWRAVAANDPAPCVRQAAGPDFAVTWVEAL